MATKNAVAKSWGLAPAWNNRRYSDPSKVPAQSAGASILDGVLRVSRASGGFGVKPIAQPIAYDDFEAGVIGNAVTGAPLLRANSGFAWSTGGSGAERHKYSNLITRGAGTKSSRAYFAPVSNGYNVTLQVEHAIPNQGDQVYFSFWLYFDRLSVTKSRNFKPWHAYGNASSYPAAYIGIGNPDFGDGSLRTARQDLSNPNNGGEIWGGPDAEALEGEWWRIEQFFEQSSPGVADGKWQSWATRGTGGAPVQLFAQDLTSIMRTSSNYHRGWAFGEYHDRINTYPDTTASDAEAAAYYDEIYFDNTRMRIELGNAPTWAACTLREVQPSSIWTDNDLQGKYNRGLLPIGSTAYVHVVRNDGSVDETGFSLPVQ